MSDVSLRHVSKSFAAGDGQVQVLHDVSTDIRLGELTMLVGPSGCGKTTLISILSGILSASAGEIELLGHSLTQMNDRKKVMFRRKNIGFIFQQYNLLPALTAAENAGMPLMASGLSMQKASQRACELLDAVGMSDHVNKLPRQLSGGQQQRVAIARALVHSPRLIVCDEPTAALDAASGKGVMDILRQIASTPERGVIVVTHDNRIYSHADRILEMSDGRLIGDHAPDAFIHKE
ncbi:ABC transporter ATP-binding protein [Asticcacaulis sp. DXS10W]|uniref:ABC transporter ATP-binding protein n=1 Tax=Asticcacaulis currens TaxID=2984210 RepID=A0ABT5IDY2_9CAUL|nr:ABC transporter ATP-binding protein [Asticcacaulis currens]MDC7694182.1 ABC transporter ATP-binding protein [Asticcacaulis currens]